MKAKPIRSAIKLLLILYPMAFEKEVKQTNEQTKINNNITLAYQFSIEILE